MREVPRYLQARLCQSPASGRSTRFTDGEEDEEALVRLPPVPQFKFVQDNQVREMQRTIIFSLDHWLYSIIFTVWVEKIDCFYFSIQPRPLQYSRRDRSLNLRRIPSHSPTSPTLRRNRPASSTQSLSLKLPSTNLTNRQQAPPPRPPSLRPPVQPRLQLQQLSDLSITNYLHPKSLKTEQSSRRSSIRDL